MDIISQEFQGELGYYDLRLKENLVRQVELAKHYGIYGFSFYFYSWGDKRALEKPLDMFLENKDIDFKFNLCWCVEDWTTKTWTKNNSGKGHVIFKHSKDVAEFRNVIFTMRKYLLDDRYYTINGAKVIQIYLPHNIPELSDVLTYWRKVMEKDNIDLYVIAAFREQYTTKVNYINQGVDATVGWAKDLAQGYVKKMGRRVDLINKDFIGNIYDYKYFVENKKYLLGKAPNRYMSIMPGWDDTPRRGNSALVWTNSSPKLYQKWLEDIIIETKANNTLSDDLIFYSCLERVG